MTARQRQVWTWSAIGFVIFAAVLGALVERMTQEDMHYPLHLGVTEAGDGEDGRIKSSIGIGSLLLDGLGDTIRVSLTEDSVYEIPVAQAIAGKAMSLWQPATGGLTGSAADAIDLVGVDRIDHGNRALEDEGLTARLVADGVTLTVCPLSNLKLCVVPDLAAHPMRRMPRPMSPTTCQGPTSTLVVKARVQIGSTSLTPLCVAMGVSYSALMPAALTRSCWTFASARMKASNASGPSGAVS